MKTKGRPKLGDQAKGEIIRFRVSQADLEAVKRVAQKEGKTVSDYAREILLAKISKTV